MKSKRLARRLAEPEERLSDVIRRNVCLCLLCHRTLEINLNLLFLEGWYSQHTLFMLNVSYANEVPLSQVWEQVANEL